MGALWLVGVVLVTVASAGSTVGIILMKKSFGDTGEHQSLRDKLIWISGLAMMVGGAILDFVAFGFAAQSLIAPLGSVTLLCNVVLSPLLLGEKVAMTDWISAAIIAAGCTLAISFGDHETKTYKFDELMDLYDNEAVQAYLPVVGALTAFFFAANYMLEKPAVILAEEHRRQSPPAPEGVSVNRNTLMGLDGLDGPPGDEPSTARSTSSDESDTSTSDKPVELPGGFLVALKHRESGGDDDASLQPLSPSHSTHNVEMKAGNPGSTSRDAQQKPPPVTSDLEGEAELTPQEILPFIPHKWHMIHGFFYAAAGGLCGSCSVLFGKSVAEIIKPGLTDGDGTAWGRFETYLILIAMGGTLFIQMKGLNKGLEFHPAVFIVPVYQTFWILGSIIGGGLYFKEFQNLSQLGMAMFTVGVLTCIGGVGVLTYFRWDDEMAKYREAFGLESPEDDQVKSIGVVGLDTSTTIRSKEDRAPTRVIVERNDESSEPSDPNAINATPSPSPTYTHNSKSESLSPSISPGVSPSNQTLSPGVLPPSMGSTLMGSPVAPSPARLPPINSIKNTPRSPQSQTDTKLARAEMRKKRILRKKKLGKSES